MMVRPDIWSDSIRIRFSNTFGPKELKLGAAAIGLQEYAANIVPGTNAKITFNGGHSTGSVAVGQSMFSRIAELSRHGVCDFLYRQA